MRRELDRDLGSLIAAFRGRGEVLRFLAPLVQDVLGGIASAAPPPAQPVPVLPSRPPIVFVPSDWPPTAGQYNDVGWAAAPGVLSSLGLALTYDEVRAWILGLAQPKAAATGRTLQIWLAARTLAEVLTNLEATGAEYRAAWQRLFMHGQQPKPGPPSPEPAPPAAPGAPAFVSVTGQTSDDTATVLGDFKTAKQGIYRVTAVCGIQRQDGIGGSLSVAATFSRFANTLTLVRSDRLGAQLSPPLVGVDANFAASADHIQLTIKGKPATALAWDNHLTLIAPT